MHHRWYSCGYSSAITRGVFGTHFFDPNRMITPFRKVREYATETLRNYKRQEARASGAKCAMESAIILPQNKYHHDW
jgi:hypothetical protein